MTTESIRAGLIAFCAVNGPTGDVLDVARRLVRADTGVGLAASAPPACGLPIGWSTGPAAADTRRALVAAAVQAPDDGGRTVAAAQAVAAMASYAAVHAPMFSVMAAGIEEAGDYGRGELTDAAVGSWTPSEDEASAPLRMVAAVIAALRKGKGEPGPVARAARELGGAAVAALAGAIAATRAGGLDGIDPRGVDQAGFDDLAGGLSARRG